MKGNMNLFKKEGLNRDQRNIYEEITLLNIIKSGWEWKAPFLEKYTTIFLQFALGKLAVLAYFIVFGKDPSIAKVLSF